MILSRRQALGLLGSAAGAMSFALVSRPRAWAAACTAAPAETEGPYFVDERLNRSDITVDPSDGSVEPGIPLRLLLDVVRVDADCAPAAGVQVDVWHASATGVYSDEAAIGSAGTKFLRGYQVTDASGAVAFTTIYPGWYTGRTIHIHFKVRTFANGQADYAFTSQLYMDDALNDVVMAQSPYDGRGARDTTNAQDSIYDGALVMAVSADGNGGYVGRFTIGVSGLTAGSGGSACATLDECRSTLDAALPDAASASDRKAAKVARRLAHLDDRAGTALDHAATASGAKRRRLYRRARTSLQKLVDVATAADDAGTLGVSLSSLESAATALLALVPTS